MKKDDYVILNLFFFLVFVLILVVFGSVSPDLSILKNYGLFGSIVFLAPVVYFALRNNSLAFHIFIAYFLVSLVILSGAKSEKLAGTINLDILSLYRVFLLVCCFFLVIAKGWKLKKVLWQRPLLWFTLLCLLSVVSSFYSARTVYSLALSFSFFFTFLLSVLYTIENSKGSILRTLFFALFLVAVLSWLYYFINPDVAIYKAILWNGTVAIRFEGISNHPNTFGLVLGLLFGVVLVLLKEKLISKRWFVLLAVIVFYSMFLTESKTAMIGTVLSSISFFVLTSKRKLKIASYTLAVLGLLILLVVFNSQVILQILSNFSRSGDINEILSFTGRLGLWIRALDAVSSSPILGHGFMSSKWILEQYVYDGWEGMATHNMIIESLIFFGLIGTLLLAAIYIDGLKLILTKGNIMLSYFLPFTFVVGITETSILSRSLIYAIFLAISISWDYNDSERLISKNDVE